MTFPFPAVVPRKVPYVGWSASDKSASYTLSNGIEVNSDAVSVGGGAVWASVRCALGRSAGKFYWEEVVVVAGTADEWINGVANSTYSLSAGCGFGASSAGMRSDNNVHTWTKSQAGVLSGNNTLSNVINYAVDITAGRLYIGVNGAWAFSGDPVGGTGFWVSGISGTVYPTASSYNGNARKVRLRTLASQMTGIIPSGYTAWAGG